MFQSYEYENESDTNVPVQWYLTRAAPASINYQTIEISSS